MLPRLIRPFNGAPAITQVFGHNWPGVEPSCYLCPDGSISFRPVPGARLGNWHDGVDYALPSRTTLIAPADGTVLWAGWDTTGFGLRVDIGHDGYMTLLAHCNNVLAGEGSRVKQGQPVALSGTTGNSSGPHLHWSVVRLKDNRYMPPAMFLANPPPQPGKLTFRDVRWFAHQAGFRGEAKRVIAAIAYAESRFNPRARLVNTDGSVDRGILQINSKWHAEVSDACADSPPCAFKQAYRISSNGSNFTPWTTFNLGAHLPYVDAPDTMT